ncbi:hypothetical protein FRB90_003727 [Tulasnella sp. 427]|nr:hypothetical protein FRB90_003727 [Tulasnella sp. 427]
MTEYIINVENDTHFPILLDGTYITDGQFNSLPSEISPNGPASIRLSTNPGKPGGGINAGNAWVFNLPAKQVWNVATGYGLITGNPVKRQVGVVESNDPQDGAEAAGTGDKITSSSVFTDNEGNKFELAAEATLSPTIIKFTVVPQDGE